MIKGHPPGDYEQAMTVEDLAGYLGLAKGTIYNKVHRREIPFFKVGRAVRFRRSQIDDWTQGQHPDGDPPES